MGFDCISSLLPNFLHISYFHCESQLFVLNDSDR